MLQIDTLYKIADDELFASWMNFIVEENGGIIMPDKQRFAEMFLGYPSGMYIRKDYIENLENISIVYHNTNYQSELFPGLDEILKNHTDLYATLPFRSLSAQSFLLEGILREKRRPEDPLYALQKNNSFKYRICPCCLEDDLRAHGRVIIHVPHTLPGVQVCWKHKIRLQEVASANVSYDDLIVNENVTEAEINTATFMYSMYKTPVISSLEEQKILLRKALTDHTDDFLKSIYDRLVSNAESEGYFPEGCEMHNSLVSALSIISSKSVRMDALSRFFAYLTQNGLAFTDNANTTQSHEILANFNESPDHYFKLIRTDGFFAEFQCNTCGSVFHMSLYAALIGASCPVCANKMTDEAVFQRYLSHFGDGNYSFVDGTDDMRVMHNSCGTIMSHAFPTLIKKRETCPLCKERSEWFNYGNKRLLQIKKHNRIGETRLNSVGEPMEIIDYEDSSHLRIRFADGTVLNDIQYSTFKTGCISNPNSSYITLLKYREDRIGEKNQNENGEWMSIIAYRSASDIDVLFSDGTIAEHKKYKDFVKGKIKKPSHEPKKPKIIPNKELSAAKRHKTASIAHLGERHLSECGEWMQIIAYRLSNDIDIQFDDGTIVQHKGYGKFKRGEIGNPNTYHNEREYPKRRIGLKNKNDSGEWMEIIEYTSAKDITVRFDDGRIVEHQTYGDFIKGCIH